MENRSKKGNLFNDGFLIFITLKISTKYYAHFYVLAVAIKRSKKVKKREMKSSSNSYLVQVVDNLLSLMKIKADPGNRNYPGSLYT